MKSEIHGIELGAYVRFKQYPTPDEVTVSLVAIFGAVIADMTRMYNAKITKVKTYIRRRGNVDARSTDPLNVEKLTEEEANEWTVGSKYFVTGCIGEGIELKTLLHEGENALEIFPFNEHEITAADAGEGA